MIASPTGQTKDDLRPAVAHDAGRAITETTFRSLNTKAEKLAQAIIDRLAVCKEAP